MRILVLLTYVLLGVVVGDYEIADSPAKGRFVLPKPLIGTCGGRLNTACVRGVRHARRERLDRPAGQCAIRWLAAPSSLRALTAPRCN